ncbi:hypothetical protein JW979_04635 [bacterium]|nr:hypothetical protein [candidate division CSSED10-310 bacterium]
MTAFRKHIRSDVVYAETSKGWELPVIDLTHPAFGFDIDKNELSEISRESLRWLKRYGHLPGLLRRLISSRLPMIERDNHHWGNGMSAYLQKLGPENLPKILSGIWSRRISRLIGAVCLRLRLRDMVKLSVEHLVKILPVTGNRPLCMVNIGGGTAADSLNTLLTLHRTFPSLLLKQRIAIYVLDTDTAAPLFGSRALAALMSNDGPLAGLRVSFHHITRDWNHPESLGMLLKHLREMKSVVMVSSEGALFEYGSDEVIIANLAMLRDHSPPETIIIGSVIQRFEDADPNLILLQSITEMPIRFMGLNMFEQLAGQTGWSMAASPLENPFFHVVCLTKR